MLEIMTPRLETVLFLGRMILVTFSGLIAVRVSRGDRDQEQRQEGRSPCLSLAHSVNHNHSIFNGARPFAILSVIHE
jgi:hypothetical protein